MKNKKTIYLLALIFLCCVAVASTAIIAWLTDSKETESVSFTVGDVEYTWSGAMAQSPVVPGQNLIATPYTLTNASTVLSELRLRINSTSTILGGDATSLIDLVMGAGWVLNADGYWYYQGTDTQSVVEGEITKYKIPTSVASISVLTGLSLKGSLVGNTYSNTTLTVSLTFQAKQSDYVTWEQLGVSNIDFTTGL